MNKKLVLNKLRNHHIQFLTFIEGDKLFSLKGAELEDYCEDTWNDLQSSDYDVLFYASHRKKGYLVAVLADKPMNKVYFITTLVTEYNTELVKVFINTNDGKNADDFVNIAKFFNKNIDELARSYKEQIISGKEEFKKFLAESENLPKA